MVIPRKNLISLNAVGHRVGAKIFNLAGDGKMAHSATLVTAGPGRKINGKAIRRTSDITGFKISRVISFKYKIYRVIVLTFECGDGQIVHVLIEFLNNRCSSLL